MLKPKDILFFVLERKNKRKIYKYLKYLPWQHILFLLYKYSIINNQKSKKVKINKQK